jgi:AAA domain
LRNAARDLWRALEVDRTVHPESHENTRQESIDALYEMAKFAGIGDDDAQGILVSCFKEQPKSNGADVYNMHTGERLNSGVDQGDTPKNGWRTHVFTAASLKEKKFEQISFVVPNLIPEGLTIFAGRPKVGKSWWALDVALAKAGGRFVLGELHLTEGDVLYAALEDNDRRLRSRIERILTQNALTWPDRLTLATQWRRLDAGGVEDAKEWAASVKEPRLIIFDTLAGVRPERSYKDTLYDGDYRALTELQAWAGQAGISVIILHHTRKMESDDPIDSVSGTLGLTGCVDTVAVLARTRKGTTLYIRGRDVGEQEKAIVFNKETCRWTILGEAEEVHQSDTRRAIVTLLNDVSLVSEALGPKEIALRTYVSENTVNQRLIGMLQGGEIIKVSRGSYISAKRSDLVRTYSHKKHQS